MKRLACIAINDDLFKVKLHDDPSQIYKDDLLVGTHFPRISRTTKDHLVGIGSSENVHINIANYSPEHFSHISNADDERVIEYESITTNCQPQKVRDFDIRP